MSARAVLHSERQLPYTPMISFLSLSDFTNFRLLDL